MALSSTFWHFPGIQSVSGSQFGCLERYVDETCFLSSRIIHARFAVGLSASAQDVADRIWTGGPIHTMDDARPTVAAIAEKDGRILVAGTTDEVMRHRGDGTEM